MCRGRSPTAQPGARYKQYLLLLTSSKPSFFSFSESGRHRTTTFTHSLRAVLGRADFSILKQPLSLRNFSSKLKVTDIDPFEELLSASPVRTDFVENQTCTADIQPHNIKTRTTRLNI